MKKFTTQFRNSFIFIFLGFSVLGSLVQAAGLPNKTASPVIVNGRVPQPLTPIRRLLMDDSAFADQKIKSENFMIQNLNIPGVRPGIIVASPSQNAPNYFFHWIRDAAITFMQVQNLYLTDAGGIRNSIQSWMTSHMSLNIGFQAIPNLMAGLGEPKFNFDGSAFQGPWGRPQTDGPALRAISFIYFLNTVIKENWPNQNEILARLYSPTMPNHSLIKLDLEYVAHNWNISSFDLWEEAYGAHFFTLMVQRRALMAGAQLARRLGDNGAAQFYSQQAQSIGQALQAFWNSNLNYILTSINVLSGPRKVTSLDSSVLLAALYGDIGDGYYAPYDDRVLATLQALKDVFQKEYPLNRDPNLGVAMGRYPEDTYDGVNTNSIGNPWFIASQAAAEVYYRTALHLLQVKQLQINPINLRFFNSLMNGQTIFKNGQVIANNDAAIKAIAQQLFAQGDRELELTLMHRGSDGALSEQINRNSGYMQGAVNLTWSHASYLSALAWRNYIRNQM